MYGDAGGSTCMVLGVARSHNLLLREGLRLFSTELKATLDELKTLLSDAFLKVSSSTPPSESFEDCTDAISIMCVIQGAYLEKCCHVKDVMYAHHVILCWSMDAPDSASSKKLFDVYLCLEDIEDAIYMCIIAKPEILYWNSLISRCCKCGKAKSAFEVFEAMKREDILPDCVTFVILLKVCSSFEEGKLLHAQALEYVSDPNVFVKSTLVDLYAKWGSIDDAHDVFNKMEERTIVSWSVMIAGFVEAGYINEAFNTFHQMQMLHECAEEKITKQVWRALHLLCSPASGTHTAKLQLGSVHALLKVSARKPRGSSAT